MNELLYCPQDEANAKGIAVKFMNFKILNSFLTKSIIYLRESMGQIEKRCALTHELVHHSRNHFDVKGLCPGHSDDEEVLIRHETAKKLIPANRLYQLMESCMSYEQIAKELNVTKDVLNDYFKYCRSKNLSSQYSKV